MAVRLIGESPVRVAAAFGAGRSPDHDGIRLWKARARPTCGFDRTTDPGHTASKERFYWRLALRDGVPDEERDAAGATTARLIYPFAAPPAPGAAVEVADRVLWLRLPLPMALDHINVWALRDGDGWTIVDTGVETPQGTGAWEAAFAGPLEGRPVVRVICTHMHPDHVGLAGWLTERFGCRLWMTRLEYVTCRMLLVDTGPAPQSAARFYREAGWTEAQIERWRSRYGLFARGVSRFPDSYRRIEAGETIGVGADVWRVVGGDGHSPEHACLLRESDGLLISGDQVLPRISSNVSVWPTEPDADPLGDWLESLARLKAALPDDALVLPSHGEPFRGLHLRLDALARGHRRALDRLERLLGEPRRAVDVFGALFARTVDDGLLGMATGEALAHLNRLEREGRAEKTVGPDGVVWWRATAATGLRDKSRRDAPQPDDHMSRRPEEPRGAVSKAVKRARAG
jgi:glyoxylase-like metal-dependent hydrolase (beta-lactamase superfamily II)